MGRESTRNDSGAGEKPTASTVLEVSIKNSRALGWMQMAAAIIFTATRWSSSTPDNQGQAWLRVDSVRTERQRAGRGSGGPGHPLPHLAFSTRQAVDPISHEGWIRSDGRGNKFSSTWWLKTIHMYHLPQRGGRRSEISPTGLKLRCQQAVLPPETLGGNLFLCLFLLPELGSTPWLLPPASKPAGKHLAAAATSQVSTVVKPRSSSIFQRPL